MPKYSLFFLISLFLTNCMPLHKSHINRTNYNYLKKSSVQGNLLYKLKNWHIEAAISLSSKTEHTQARLIWDQKQTAFSGKIYSYFSTDQLLIQGNDQWIFLEDGRGHHYQSKTKHTMFKALGESPLPLNHLPYWIKGLHDPKLSYEATYYPETGSFRMLKQAGWRIDYKRYTTLSSYTLPERIDFYKNDSYIRLVISIWTFNDLISRKAKPS